MHILDDIIDKALGLAVGAADRPCACDVAAIALQLTSCVHEDQLPIVDSLHEAVPFTA